MRLVLRLLALAALAYVGLCLLVVLARNRLVFAARGARTGDPRQSGIADGERVVIPTSDGERLVAWYLPSQGTARPSGAVIWFHGNAETVAGLAPLLRELRPARAALLAVEYRGYAGSTGRTTVAGSLLDAEAAWDWLAARPDVDTTRIVVYGRSVGSGPAAYLAAHRPAAGLILESAFTSLRAMARVHYPMFPSAIAGPGFDNLAAIATATCPVLLIRGELDRTVPPWMADSLAARAGARAEVWTIPGADHNDTIDMGGEEYLRRFSAFLARTAERPRQ